ncbi:type II toxin-antitoxin system Phd/YefM family antitoxin [Luteolibacter algae]|uniref:Antitoxin n=1 Tax=Luteolibacter algae TaxID=454151 RepID=A0ABW5D9W4_9BACT
MRTATVREAQHHLSKLLVEVEKGEEILITRRGKEVCKITPVNSSETRKVDWKLIHSEMHERLGEMPTFDYGIVERMREDERF